MKYLALIISAFLVIACSENENPAFRIPAEWEAQKAVWVGWDNNEEDKNDVIGNIVKELQANDILVKIAFSSDSIADIGLAKLDSLEIDTAALVVNVFEEANIWIRDYGGIYIVDTLNEAGILDFGWNQYGQLDWSREKWPAWFEGKNVDSLRRSVENRSRSKIDSLMGVESMATTYEIDVLLEGGSFETNGNGVLIQCEAVTLQRNPGKSKEDLEQEFSRYGIEKVIWLPQGVIEDEHFSKLIDNKYMVGGTGGHTDEFVRFVDENTILLAWINEEDIDDHLLNKENFDRMSRNYEILSKASDLSGKPFKIIKMPIPKPVETPLKVVERWYPGINDNSEISLQDLDAGHNLSLGDTIQAVAAAGYLNFLITNGMVLAASYAAYGSEDEDKAAYELLQKSFPKRKIVMIDALALNSKYGGGGIHCVTMQEPTTD